MNKETNMICEDCGSKIQIIYFKDVDPIKEIWMRADYMYCPGCDKRIIVDDSFDYKVN